MDERRKAVGKRLQRRRRAAGYRSQAAFAAAIDISESSVAQAESGSERVGRSGDAFQKIEDGLQLPPGIITAYLDSGDEALLDHIAGVAPTVQAVPPAEDEELPLPEDEKRFVEGLINQDFEADEILELLELLRARKRERSAKPVRRKGE